MRVSLNLCGLTLMQYSKYFGTGAVIRTVVGILADRIDADPSRIRADHGLQSADPHPLGSTRPDPRISAIYDIYYVV